MKRRKIILGLFVSTIIIASCETKTQKNKTIEESVEKTDTISETVEINVDSIVTFIDSTRANIESLDLKRYETATEKFREKIKQKWSNIHFYTIDGELVKIKTYPYEGISERTEEFYIDDAKLVLATIEDKGLGSKGKPKSEIDKMYYFHNGELIKEVKSNAEVEYKLRNSDAEELLAEYSEYLEIYKQTVK